jgi:para-aminobenzoate synthetase component I
MTRTFQSFPISDFQTVKDQLFHWSQNFREVVFLDSNQNHDAYGQFEILLAVDAFTAIQTDSFQAFESLKEYQSRAHDWLFGYLSYDLKNDVEDLQSQLEDGLEFPDLFFFQPKKVISLDQNHIHFQYLALCDDEITSDWEYIQNLITTSVSTSSEHISIEAKLTPERYQHQVEKLLEHIQRGDIYEVNFCMEFFAKQACIDPENVYKKLNNISTPPMAVFLKNNHHFLMSASPERYIKKSGVQVVSQPIKGTAKRFEDPILDLASKNDLQNNPKERSENVMIVDLVRNDLSRTATKGSVQVAELCKIYSFKQVHQKISTIVSEVAPNISPIDILKTTFPMGSMTGAPKVSAMQLIEKYEATKRGLYSGAVGYFTPAGDFDFNVVIRSILYHEKEQYVSFSVGSAITSKSVPEKEYEECMLKAKAMFEVLSSGT